jgi:hypothetical protein
MPELTRRTFLKGSAGAIALAALPISLGAQAGTEGLPIRWQISERSDRYFAIQLHGRMAVRERNGNETVLQYADLIDVDMASNPEFIERCKRAGEASMIRHIRREGYTNPRMM